MSYCIDQNHRSATRNAERSISRSATGILFACLALMACLAAGSPAGAVAAEKVTHIFDATLSLTGNCSTSGSDPVPDPGLCPMPPGVPGVDHPSKPFEGEMGVAVDRYGDKYVGSAPYSSSVGRISIFDPAGNFITEITGVPHPVQLAIDGEGNLYVKEGGEEIWLYAPTAWDPPAGEIEYADPPTQPLRSPQYFAINPANDRVFIGAVGAVEEYGSAAEGNSLIDSGIGEGIIDQFGAVAIDAAHGLLFAGTTQGGSTEPTRSVIRVFELAPPNALVGTIDGSTAPAGKFETAAGFFPLAVEEATGHIFFAELGNVGRKKVLEFEADGSYVSTIERSFSSNSNAPSIAVDNGATSPAKGTLYVPSGSSSPVHLFAFIPKPPVEAPSIEKVSVSGITEDEAVLHATILPGGLETHYSFEYTTQQHFEEAGGTFAGAVVAKEGTLPAGNAAVALSAPLASLSPSTAYRFRVVATNEEGPDEEEGVFTTYRPPYVFGGCPNESVRSGTSAALPDCRAYELVTPSNTNGHVPFGVPRYTEPGTYTPTRGTSFSGGAVSFLVEGGGIPGLEGTGGLKGDSYLATRGVDGWSTVLAGPTGGEFGEATPGSFSPQQTYNFFNANNETYLRYPDGHYELIGRGDLGTDDDARGRLISNDGLHVVFSSSKQLEPDAPPSGTEAIYDRSLGGEEQTRVVSVMPDGSIPSEKAGFRGASKDARGVSFSVGSKLYLRYQNEPTFEIGDGVTFAGFAEGGGQVFYLQGGDLWRFDVAGETRTRFTESGDVTLVNVSTDGSTAYFLSTSALIAGSNPRGVSPDAGEQNLYRSREGQLSFVGIVAEEDVEPSSEEGEPEGLGAWVAALQNGQPDLEASRTTPDGSVLVFSSRADLTGYDTGGHAQLYRYDGTAGTLTCLSCNPTDMTAVRDAKFYSRSKGWGQDFVPLSRYAEVENLRADGRRVFFESLEALVSADTDGVRDVYEWEEQGVGSCADPGGCVYLISSGESAEPNYLYAVSASGDDVFIETPDRLLAEDPDETPSIYDARVNGGFAPPSPPAGECLGEACQPQAVPPVDPTLTSSSFHGAGNVTGGKPKTRCPKGKRKASHGKRRCVPRHHRKHRQAHDNGRKHR